MIGPKSLGGCLQNEGDTRPEGTTAHSIILLARRNCRARGVSAWGGVHLPPWTEFNLTHACENITLSATSFADGRIYKPKYDDTLLLPQI